MNEAGLIDWIEAQLDKYGRYDRLMVIAIALGAVRRSAALRTLLTTVAVDRSGRRVEQVRWPQVDDRRLNEGRRFADTQPDSLAELKAEEIAARVDPDDDDRPYSPCRWADVPTTGFL